MKLEFARLKNFRQFCGEQNADFSTFDDLNVWESDIIPSTYNCYGLCCLINFEIGLSYIAL